MLRVPLALSRRYSLVVLRQGTGDQLRQSPCTSSAAHFTIVGRAMTDLVGVPRRRSKRTLTDTTDAKPVDPKKKPKTKAKVKEAKPVESIKSKGKAKTTKEPTKAAATKAAATKASKPASKTKKKKTASTLEAKMAAHHTVVVGEDGKKRCSWAASPPIYTKYHDEEWGRKIVGDDRKLFEFLSLEGCQAGLSWLTILKKRENYRRHFRDFDIDAVAETTEAEIEAMMGDAGLVRHRGKLLAIVNNAKLVQAISQEFGSFSDYVWGFAPPSRHSKKTKAANPAFTLEAEVMSTALKKRGFKFVGPTCVYAFMQATGMVDDHMPGCFAYKEADEEDNDA